MGYKVVTSGAFVASQSVNNNKVNIYVETDVKILAFMDYSQSFSLNQKQQG